MTSRNVIEDILAAGIKAPSGENSQPWRFKVEGQQVWLFNNPDADRSLYNFHQNGSLVSHGAVLENMRIAGIKLGYELKFDLFPDENDENLIAKIDLKEVTPGDAPLYDTINKRVTNRKHYDSSPLTDVEKTSLLANDVVGVRLALIENREKIKELAHAASVNETMLVLNRSVHDFFFSHVRWTPEENMRQPNGFFIDTLELNPSQAKGFKLLRSWAMARLLGLLGVANVVRNDNEATYKTASAMVGIMVKDSTPKNLISAGQAFERAWLAATELGLSVQPCTGALFLAQGIPHENWIKFSKSQREVLLNAKQIFYKTIEVNSQEEYIAVVFRVGRSDPPTAQAARFPLETFLIH